MEAILENPYTFDGINFTAPVGWKVKSELCEYRVVVDLPLVVSENEVVMYSNPMGVTQVRVIPNATGMYLLAAGCPTVAAYRAQCEGQRETQTQPVTIDGHEGFACRSIHKERVLPTYVLVQYGAGKFLDIRINGDFESLEEALGDPDVQFVLNNIELPLL